MNNYRAPLSIFLAALVLLLISSRNSAASQLHNYPTRPPENIEHRLGTLNLADLGTQNVSVTIWNADNAASRMENIKETARAKADPNLTHIGINVGDNPDLAEAYLRRDALAGDSLQLFATPDQAEHLAKTYGFRTLYR